VLKALHPISLIVLFLLSVGCQGRPAVPDLLADNPDKRGKALEKLIRLRGQNVDKLIPPLIDSLQEEDSRLVNRGVDALSVIGAPAIPALREALKTKDVYARLSAALALGLIGEPSAIAVPDLVILLKDPHPLVRDEAAMALGFIGPTAEKAVPTLISTLKDENEDGREAAAIALDKIATPEAKKALKKHKKTKKTS